MNATEYRACYYFDGQAEVVLTGEEEQYLSEDQLIESAVHAAIQAGIIGDEFPRIPIGALRAKLQIGMWRQ